MLSHYAAFTVIQGAPLSVIMVNLVYGINLTKIEQVPHVINIHQLSHPEVKLECLIVQTTFNVRLGLVRIV